jgi:hypothetical protein
MDQWLIASLVLVVVVIFISVFEIWRAERQSKAVYEPTETGVEPDPLPRRRPF